MRPAVDSTLGRRTGDESLGPPSGTSPIPSVPAWNNEIEAALSNLLDKEAPHY
jgi:hypothetical protein